MLDLKSITEQLEEMKLGDFEYRSTDEEYIALYREAVLDLDKVIIAARKLRGKLLQEIGSREEMIAITKGATRGAVRPE